MLDEVSSREILLAVPVNLPTNDSTSLNKGVKLDSRGSTPRMRLDASLMRPVKLIVLSSVIRGSTSWSSGPTFEIRPAASLTRTLVSFGDGSGRSVARSMIILWTLHAYESCVSHDSKHDSSVVRSKNTRGGNGLRGYSHLLPEEIRNQKALYFR